MSCYSSNQSGVGSLPVRALRFCATVAGRANTAPQTATHMKREITESVIARYWHKVIKAGENECWGWRGAITKHGYANIRIGGRNTGAIGIHQLSWIIHNGQIPDFIQVNHKCDNPTCSNPNHLTLGTHKDNMADRTAKGRNRSPKGEANGGHILTEAQVQEIRKSWEGGNSQKSLSEKHGVHPSTISLIVRTKTWK